MVDPSVVEAGQIITTSLRPNVKMTVSRVNYSKIALRNPEFQISELLGFAQIQ
jgi:hypothetical protein